LLALKLPVPGTGEVQMCVFSRPPHICVPAL